MRARHGRTRAASTVATLVGGALLTGCAVQAAPTLTARPSSSPSASATRTPAGADCLAPQVLSALGFDPAQTSGATHPDAPDPGPVPEDFRPVLAVECSTGETLSDSAGRWSAVTATRREGGLDPLLAALDGGSTPSPTVTCAPGGQRSELWLVDVMGDAVRVTVPGAVCGRLPANVRAALDGLDAVDTEHYPVLLTAPRQTAG